MPLRMLTTIVCSWIPSWDGLTREPDPYPGFHCTRCYAVSVICCWVTCHPKTRWLKTTAISMVTETDFLGEKKYKMFQNEWWEVKRKFVPLCMMCVCVCILLLCALSPAFHSKAELCITLVRQQALWQQVSYLLCLLLYPQRKSRPELGVLN